MQPQCPQTFRQTHPQILSVNELNSSGPLHLFVTSPPQTHSEVQSAAHKLVGWGIGSWLWFVSLGEQERLGKEMRRLCRPKLCSCCRCVNLWPFQLQFLKPLCRGSRPFQCRAFPAIVKIVTPLQVLHDGYKIRRQVDSHPTSKNQLKL